MRGVRGASVSLAGSALALGWLSRVSGHSQLVMEQSFHMDTTTCEGASCRKEIIGANEALGVGSVVDCSARKTYWHGTLENGEWSTSSCLFVGMSWCAVALSRLTVRRACGLDRGVRECLIKS